MNAAAIARALGSRVVRSDRVAGGDINEAHRVELADHRVVFVKSNARAPAGLFAAEIDGLHWLAACDQLHVPRPLAHGDDWLALEWFEPGGRPDPAALGRALASLHSLGAPGFGYARPNFLATLPQDNTAELDWPTFYIERRVRPLCRRAGLAVDRELDRLRARVDRFGPPEPPARLHGDLWWGNVASRAGVPAIFDPAVYGGHREIDLAMLALFGPLADAFVAAYEDIAPLAPGWRERIALHQLHPLAAHACLFGGGYAAQVAAVLSRLA